MLTKLSRRVFIRSAELALGILPLTIFIAVFEFTLPLKLDSINLSFGFIGAFITFSWIATTFLDVIWGRYIDKFGKRNTVIAGIFLFAIFTVLMGLTNNLWLLLIYNLLAYIGFDLIYIALEGMLMVVGPKSQFRFASSGFFPIWSLGFVLGPLIAAATLVHKGLSFVFFLGPPLCVLSILLFIFLCRKIHYQEKRSLFNKNLSIRKILKHSLVLMKKQKVVLLGIFLCTFWFTMMQIGIPLLFAVEEKNIWNSAFVAAAFVAPFLLTDLVDGFLARTQHLRQLIIILGFFIGGVCLILFYFSHNIFLCALAAFCSTLSIDMTWTTLDIEAGLIAPAGAEAETGGVFAFAKNVGFDLSPLFFGVIASFFGARLPFLILGCVFIIACLLIWRLKNKIN